MPIMHNGSWVSIVNWRCQCDYKQVIKVRLWYYLDDNVWVTIIKWH